MYNDNDLQLYNIFIFYIFIFKFFFTNITDISMLALPLYTSCLLSMLLNDDTVDIERPNVIF